MARFSKSRRYVNHGPQQGIHQPIILSFYQYQANRTFCSQQAALRYALPDHEFEFVEGSVPWPPHPSESVIMVKPLPISSILNSLSDIWLASFLTWS